jgi:hypothetical protein
MTTDHMGDDERVSRRKVMECMTWDEREDCEAMHLRPHMAGTIVVEATTGSVAEQ